MFEASNEQSRLSNLVRTRVRTTWLLLVLLTLAGGTVTLDLLIAGSHPARPLTLTFNLLYGLYMSLLATVLVSRTVVATQISGQRAKERQAIGVLGILDELAAGQVALVVPAFVNMPAPGDEVQHQAVRATLAERLHFEPSAQLMKNRSDIGTYAYARRDVLLVTDLVRLAGIAGMPQPFIVSDIAFCEALHAARVGDGYVRVQTGHGDPGSLRVIRAAVIIGLWSNIATLLLSDHNAIPFTLIGTEDTDRRQIRLRTPQGGRQDVVVPSEPDGPEDGPAQGLFGRFRFEDLTVVVVGGIRSLGTARMGDLISRRPASCNELWNIPDVDDMWAFVAGPPKGKRGQDHDVIVSYHGEGEIRKQLRHAVDLLPHIDLRELNRGPNEVVDASRLAPDEPLG